MLRFPLWLLQPLEVLKIGRFLRDEDGNLFAFTSKDDADDYRRARNLPTSVACECRQENAMLLLADMLHEHVPGLCLDPSPENDCHPMVPTADFARAIYAAPSNGRASHD